VVLGSLAVMTGCVGKVLRCALVMLCCFFGHAVTPFYSRRALPLYGKLPSQGK
jgi:hypothetical protein